MDDRRFDDLARALAADPATTVGPTRRAALGLALGGLLGALRRDAGAKKKQCKPKCGPCERCRRGRCKPKPNDTPCGTGICQSCFRGTCFNRPDDAACNGDGKCLGGTCNPRPTCGRFGTACSPAGNNPNCCGNECVTFPGPPPPNRLLAKPRRRELFRGR